MKILHINSGVDPRQGGPTSAMVAMMSAQRDVGLEIVVAATFGADFRSDSADQMKSIADVHLIGPCTHRLAWHRDIKPTLRKLIATVDVVHIHAVWEEIQHQAAKISRELGKPYVISPHGMLDPWSLSQSAVMKTIYLALRMKRDLDRASAIHFTTETERDLVAPLAIKAPAIVEPLIIDLADFQPPPPRGQFLAQFKEQLGGKPFLLFMSRIHRKKGLDLLIPALAKLKDVSLVIAGPDVGGYRAVIENFAREHGVFDRVIFPGMLYGRDRAAALVDAALFVLPSYQENFGVVVIESLAAGTPVIISDQVNIHRQITQARAGEVVTTDVARLTDALSRWLSVPAMRGAASRRGIEFVAREFDRTAQARRWAEHYSRLAASLK